MSSRFGLQNFRMGFANNSSSTHSFVYGQNINPVPPQQEDYYGWDDFTLSTPEMKASYLATLVHRHISRNVGPQVANVVMKDLFGDGVGFNGKEIDHQSGINFPNEYGAGTVNLELIRDFRDHVMRDDVVILGGNDNSDGHPLGVLPSAVNTDAINSYGECVCRKQNGVWTVFNRDSGCKVRFSFDGEVEQNFKTVTPELVDLKITDRCSFGCTYCYMGSTKNGKDNPKISTWAIAEALGKMQVFEAAIGGGEPTQSANFIDLLRQLRRHGVVPNFTTYDLEWLNDEKRNTTILDLCGSFAYSVRDIGDANKLVEAHGSLDRKHKHKVNAQIVMGTIGRVEFESILAVVDMANIDVTLLGYKTTGFGANYDPIDYGWWPESVKKAGMWGIGIDTMLAQQTDMRGINVSEKTYHTLEGKSSCYIDMVEARMGPSSYAATEPIEPDEYGWNDSDALVDQIISKFAKY